MILSGLYLLWYNDNSRYPHKLYMVSEVADIQGHSQPVLGLQASLQLQIINMVLTMGQSGMNNETVLQEYSHLFENDLGNI